MDELDLPRTSGVARRVRCMAGAGALLAAAGLLSCAARPDEVVADDGAEASPYAASVQSHVEAMEAGMERARRDLALRSLWRRIEKPG